jgi:hypothetical protein
MLTSGVHGGEDINEDEGGDGGKVYPDLDHDEVGEEEHACGQGGMGIIYHKIQNK